MRGQNGGPKTTAGKARSRANAVKHGLRAASPVVREVESEAGWKMHLEGVIDSLQPDGYLEEEMATRVASLLWRLRRVNLFESEHIWSTIESIPTFFAINEALRRSRGMPEEHLTPKKIDSGVAASMLPARWIADDVMRYESHLHRQYIQTLHELEAMQSRRHGERTPLARLDITGSPA